MDRRKFNLSATTIAGLTAIGAIGSSNAFGSSTDSSAKTSHTPVSSMQKSLKPLYCLNTSTIQGEKIPLLNQIEIAKKAGYDGIEIWLRDVDKHIQSGGTIDDLRKHINDSGLSVEGAIAFAEWIVDDDEKRSRGLEQAKREMELVVTLGGSRIAAPPAGATSGSKLDLNKAADRYRALLEIGATTGCRPMLEVWGFSSNLHKLSEVLYVAAGAQHPDACVLPDVYHLYKGGSDFLDLPFLAGSKVPMLHMNDYPDIPRDKINDADRIYPGDGTAPVANVLKTLYSTGFNGTLSLELFNRSYWEQDPLQVATTGLNKMKAIVASLSHNS